MLEDTDAKLASEEVAAAAKAEADAKAAAAAKAEADAKADAEADAAETAAAQARAGSESNAVSEAMAKAEGTEKGDEAAPSNTGPAGEAPEGAPDQEGALAAEVDRRGLVRRDNTFTSRHKGVSWNKTHTKWRAQVFWGGKTEQLGYFTVDEEAKARYDACYLELGRDLDARGWPSSGRSGFLGVTWREAKCKWMAEIFVDSKANHLGVFEGTARGEVDAALAYDKAVRATGRSEKANFELPDSSNDGQPIVKAVRRSAASPYRALPARRRTAISSEAKDTSVYDFEDIAPAAQTRRGSPAKRLAALKKQVAKRPTSPAKQPQLKRAKPPPLSSMITKILDGKLVHCLLMPTADPVLNTKFKILRLKL
jgi:hypothetical protein